jgi:hypothetical protein
MDFTDPARPKEIAYFDRGPVNAKEVFLAGHWASYWYNGRIYAAEIARGLDVLKLQPSQFLTRNEIAAAESVVAIDYNAQSQHRIQWPDIPVVARAYLDQLIRANAIQPSRAAAVSKALDQLDHHSHPANLATLANELNALATAAASARNADRFRAIAHILTRPPATGT